MSFPSYANDNTFDSFNTNGMAENKFVQLFKGSQRTPSNLLVNSLAVPMLFNFGAANDLALEVTHGAKIGGQLHVGGEFSADGAIVASANLTLDTAGPQSISKTVSGAFSIEGVAGLDILGGSSASLKTTAGNVVIAALTSTASVNIEDMSIKANTITGGASSMYINAGDERSIIFQTEATNAVLAPALTIDKDKLAAFAGAVTVAGNLTVNGDTTTLSTSSLLVDDFTITAGASATSLNMNGGGFFWGGDAAGASSHAALTYVHSTTSLLTSQALAVTGALSSTAAVSGLSATFTNACVAGSFNDGIATYDAGVITSAVSAAFSGAVTAGSLNDGIATYDAGVITSGVSAAFSGAVTAGSFNDGLATYDQGVIGSAASATFSGLVSAGSFNDGAATYDQGVIGSAASATFSGLVSAGSFNDGAATYDQGVIGSAASATFSGLVTGGSLITTDNTVASATAGSIRTAGGISIQKGLMLGVWGSGESAVAALSIDIYGNMLPSPNIAALNAAGDSFMSQKGYVKMGAALNGAVKPAAGDVAMSAVEGTGENAVLVALAGHSTQHRVMGICSETADIASFGQIVTKGPVVATSATSTATPQTVIGKFAYAKPGSAQVMYEVDLAEDTWDTAGQEVWCLGTVLEVLSEASGSATGLVRIGLDPVLVAKIESTI